MFAESLLEHQTAFNLSRQADYDKSRCSATSPSEKHVVNLATIFWPLKQADQEINSGVC